ncbi:MAG: hypothetical protein ACPG1C_08255 [Alphaproteobacteria bacterium]
MNAINHTATALLIHNKWPHVPILPVLISVQLVEVLWVALNFLGIEAVETEAQVHSLADIHLAHMPWSHSIGVTLVIAAAVWALCALLLKRPGWGAALALGVCSHIVLDLITHAPDIVIAPGFENAKYGTGLYAVPLWAFALEFIYGLVCWWVFKGSKALLACIVVFNLGALSFYAAWLVGPEQFFAGAPLIFVGVVAVHIVTSWAAIWFFARQEWGQG